MADFQALQQKYAPVVDTIKKFEPYGAKFVGSDLAGEQYHLIAQVPSQVVLNRVWDSIKQVDSTYADLKHGHGASQYSRLPAVPPSPRAAIVHPSRVVAAPGRPRLR